MDTSPIVAVASFADDLEAVSELLSALPAECSVTLIIAQHLNAARERLVAEALAKRTSLPVAHAHDGVVAAQGHVYVGPANVTLTVTGRELTRLSCHAALPADVCPGRPSKRPPNSRSGFGIDPAVVRSLVRLPEETASAAVEHR